MAAPIKPKIKSFRSGLRVISRSAQHESMWIVPFPDGGWYSIHAGESGIQETNPPNPGSVRVAGNA